MRWFLVIFGFCEASAAVAALKRRGGCKRGDFSMVRIRLARFALPQLGYSGSKSGAFCSPLVCRVRGTIENVRASAARPEAVSIARKDHRLSENANIEKVGQTFFQFVPNCNLILPPCHDHSLQTVSK